MDRLVRRRGTCRAGITKAHGELDTELAKDVPDHDELEVLVRRLERNVQEVTELDMKIMECMLDKNATDEELTAETEEVEDYQDKAYRARRKAEKVLHPSDAESVQSVSNGSGSRSSRKTYKLPKVEFKKFSGELTEWLGWWSQFQKIHEDGEVHPSDKIQYLVQAMEPGSRAMDLVGRYPHTAENYPKVVEALKERYGKPKLLKQVYVRELLKMVMSNARTRERIDLARMYDRLEAHLRALDSLGVSFEQSADFLFPMVESSLPGELLIAWQRSVYCGKDGSMEVPPKTELDFLMEFLRQEVEYEQQRSLARSGFESSSSGKRRDRVSRSQQEEEVPTAAGLFSGQSQNCIFCSKSHSSAECFKAQSLSYDEKTKVVKESRCCFACLKPGHQSRQCKVPVRCPLCKKKHAVVMCQELSQNKKQAVGTKETEAASTSASFMGTNICSSDVLLQTLLVRLWSEDEGKSKVVRLVFDNGAQLTSVKKKTAVGLGYRSIGEKVVRRCLFGGKVTDAVRHNLYKLRVGSLDGKVMRLVNALDENELCGELARVPRGPWVEELSRKRIVLTDFKSESPLVEVLIGSDFYGSLLTGRIEQLECGLTAIETVLGWTLSGRVPQEEQSFAMTVTAMLACEWNPAELWNLESLGIQDPAESISREEQDEITKQHFRKTVTRGDDGRYSVSLPWVGGKPNIPSNYAIALARLQSMSKKLMQTDQYKNYDEVFRCWLQERVVEEVKETDDGMLAHYLPHRAVFKPESKTTPVRPVFDASCKANRNPSLNESLEKGPNMMELIPAILMRFRNGRIGVVSDVKKAFLQIEIKKEDRDFLRFLWWKDEERKSTQVFRHARVVFGVNCSPFLLAAVIEHHLSRVSKEDEEVAKELMRSLYVDNCVLSVENREEALNFQSKATEIMAEAKMDLRMWQMSLGEEDGHRDTGDETVKVLGLKWNRRLDALGIEGKFNVPEKLTKRSILSCVHQLYDPLGFFSPVTLGPKLLLQKSWAKGTSWDEEIEEQERGVFLRWMYELPSLERVWIPRNQTGGRSVRATWQLHVFGDASKLAYAAVVYLRCGEEGNVSVQLVQSKSRVAPLKKTTIPRLELMGCTIGVRLAKTVKEGLCLADIPTYFWSDSTTALAWIRRNDVWGTFVGNRVREICTWSKSTEWRHVPGKENPADLPSRGCNADEYLDSRWWEGPEWLTKSIEFWPSGKEEVDEEAVNAERKKSTVVPALICVSGELPWYCSRYSSYPQNIRLLALVLRFVSNLKKEGRRGPISVDELEQAELKMFKLAQQESLIEERGVVSGIRVKKDRNNLLRVQTKLLRREDSESFREPVILPNSHALVEQLIRWEHRSSGHAGAQFLMGKLREKVWIIGGRRAIKKVLTKCVTCRRFSSKCPDTVPATLPVDRVKDCKAFQVVGVDLAGPLFLKNRSKAWVVLYTCAVYRCVHLELVSSLSTEAFLWSFQRFITRRGRPDTVFSDNGTNFVGAANLFKTVDWKRVEAEAKVRRIEWKFNPPSAPWWGGWWERLIRVMKDLLKRILGSARVNFEELTTILCVVEAVMNGRPLTFITEDQDDLVPLTPSMFLQDVTEYETPGFDCPGGDELRKRIRFRNKLKLELRARFRREYLSLLVQRGKDPKSPPIQVGDVVLVGADNKRRLEWPLARVVELLPGTGGHVRAANVKTAHGVMLRPIRRLFPLEVSSAVMSPPVSERVRKIAVKSKSTVEAEPEVVTRVGRKVRKPHRFVNI